VPATATEFLTRFFVEDLPFTPTGRQIDVFLSDLGIVSPYLMASALKEVRAGIVGSIFVYQPNDWRPLIFQIYNRKVAEHAQLYPVFHTFETAFRSTVAVALEDHYRHSRWWSGIHQQMKKGNAATSITQISGVRVSKDAAHRIGQIVLAIDGDQFQRNIVSRINNGYQFVEYCDLAHIRQLIEVHWQLFSPRFARPGKKLTLADLKAKFERVREARNDVYHHKAVARLTNVVSTAEELLDYLNCSIGFVYSKVTVARPTPVQFAMPIEPRHNTW
jgi:hypothetical protein